MIVFGIQAVTEALRSSAARVERLWVVRGGSGGRLQAILDLARSRRIPLQFEAARFLSRRAGSPGAHKVVARLGEVDTVSLGQVLESKLLLLADGVEDPRNLGALFRTAEATGVDAVILPDRRSCGLTSTVVETSSGAALHVPVVRVTNSGRALDTLKQKGFWVLGLDVQGEERLDGVDLVVPLVLVVGGEHRGLRPSVRNRCDYRVGLPMLGRVQSLNLSVAAGVVLYEIIFARDK